MIQPDPAHSPRLRRDRHTQLEIEGIGKTYGSGPEAFTAIDEVSFTVRAGELLCIVGPSGCGKTTLLRCISGLMPASRGAVHLGNQTVISPPRSMGLVFQDYSRSLLPWMSIQANVTLPLKAQGIPRAERNQRTEEALASVHLDGHGHKYPWQLSGGMQQRAAIARALAYRAEILLLDEPFASVDAQTRAALEDLLLDVWQRTGLTVLLVTHDIDEAVYLADRVVMLSAAPTRVREIVTVDLPRPRDQIETKELPEFAHLRARVFAFIKSEIDAGAASTESDRGPRSDLPGQVRPDDGLSDDTATDAHDPADPTSPRQHQDPTDDGPTDVARLTAARPPRDR